MHILTAASSSCFLTASVLHGERKSGNRSSQGKKLKYGESNSGPLSKRLAHSTRWENGAAYDSLQAHTGQRNWRCTHIVIERSVRRQYCREVSFVIGYRPSVCDTHDNTAGVSFDRQSVRTRFTSGGVKQVMG
jgi:hypothetical protein